MSMTKCKVCGAELLPDSAFCSECGAKVGVEEVSQKSKCPHCGADLIEGALFCSECGAKLGGTELQNAEEPEIIAMVASQVKKSELEPQVSDSPVTPPPEKPPVQSYQSESSSPNPTEIASAVSFVLAQNSKIRTAADNIVNTDRVMQELTTRKNKKDDIWAFSISAIQRDSKKAADWENVVYDIESTKKYIIEHQYNDSTYKNTVEDFMQSANIAIKAMKKMSRYCTIGIICFPIAMILSFFIMLWVVSVPILGPVFCLVTLFLLIITFVNWIVLIIQKKKFNAFFKRVL